MRPNFFPTLILSLLTVCFSLGYASGVENLKYELIATYEHDTKAWTQGLYYEGGTLYESTGLYGQSSVRRVELESGKVLQKKNIHARYFGEGLTLFQDKLYMLTWKHEKGFIFDKDSFEKVGEFSYSGEGWGLTHCESHLIMSDGSHVIRFLDPETFEVVRSIEVRSGKRPIADLNELEYIEGYIYANIWYTNYIAKIDPASGQVVGSLDLSKLWPDRPQNPDAVMNGIAYVEASGRLLITGKLWSKLFEIRIVE